MGFRQADSEGRGGFARIWSVEDKGNYSTAKVSTSRKRKDADGNDYWETDFQDGFVRLIGSAHTKAKELDIPVNDNGESKGVAIQITSCEVTMQYNAEKKKNYTNYAIFAFDIPDGNGGTKSSNIKKTAAKTTKKSTKSKTKKEAPVEDDDDLPFN